MCLGSGRANTLTLHILHYNFKCFLALNDPFLGQNHPFKKIEKWHVQKRKEYIHKSGLLLAGVGVSKAKGALSIFDLLQQGLSLELMHHLRDQ